MATSKSDPQQNHRRDASPQGRWLPLMDYAMEKGVSLSTLRRHIKANKVAYKIENGRYLLLDSGDCDARPAPPPPSTVLELKAELEKAQEEIAELKMLIAIYEERMPHVRLDV